MIASRASALALALAAAVAVAAPAAAQTPEAPRAPSAPLSLTPPERTAPQPDRPGGDAPRTALPPAPGDPDAPPAEPNTHPTPPPSDEPQIWPPKPASERIHKGPDARNDTTGVEVAPLRGPDPDSVGVLGDDAGSLGADMWRGTPRTVVERLIPRLPAATVSPAMRDLMRRLLLTGARIPEGEAETSLLALRIERLAAMGDLDAVRRLLDAAPKTERPDALRRIEADTLFLTSEYANACALVGDAVAETEDVYWQKAVVFCQALAGNHDRAALGAGLLREQGADDPVFFRLLDALATGTQPSLDSLEQPQPLHLAMARAARAKLPEDATRSNAPLVLRTIAVNPTLAPERRLAAAERAEAMGALPTEVLRDIYGGIEFTEQQLSEPLSTAEQLPGPMARALLFVAARGHSLPAAKAEVTHRALAMALQRGHYESAVRVFLPLIIDIPPSQDFQWLAPDVVRALLAVGAVERADQWMGILRTASLFNREAEQSLADLMALARLGNMEQARGLGAGSIERWWDAERRRPDARAHGVLLFSLLEGLGETVPAPLWTRLIELGGDAETAVVPDPAVWRVATDAAAAGRRGETVALVLIGLGTGGPVRAHPVVLRDLLGALAATGLEAEARALALEAAVSAGL